MNCVPNCYELYVQQKFDILLHFTPKSLIAISIIGSRTKQQEKQSIYSKMLARRASVGQLILSA